MFDFLLKVKKLERGVLRISGAGVYRYLFVGSKQSVLVDTGYGLANLPRLVNTYVDSPLTVLNTHYHPDHSGGNRRFREVHVHPADQPFTGELSYEQLVHTAVGALVENRKVAQFGVKALGKFSKFVDQTSTKYVPMPDGTTFDLGDRLLKIKYLPGHTEGSCVVLDPARQTIYTGDACNPGFWMWTNPKISLSDYADTLDRFYQDIQAAGYKKLVNSHTPMPNQPGFLWRYANFARSIQKGSSLFKVRLPGYPDDPLCFKMKPSLKDCTVMMCFYFESQAAGPMPDPNAPSALELKLQPVLGEEKAHQVAAVISKETLLTLLKPLKILKLLNPLNLLRALNPVNWVKFLLNPKNWARLFNPKGLIGMIKDARRNGVKSLFTPKRILAYFNRKITGAPAEPQETLPDAEEPLLLEEPKKKHRLLPAKRKAPEPEAPQPSTEDPKKMAWNLARHLGKKLAAKAKDAINS